MSFEILYVIFIVVTVLNYVFLDIKVDKIKKESLDKDKVIGSLMAHNSALRRLNDGYKDHERRLNDIKKLLLSKKREKPEEPEEPELTCKDCEFCHQYESFFRCKKTGYSYPIECNNNKACQDFEKKESLNEDEYVVYANNVKIDISSKEPRVYKTDRILTHEEWLDRISRLFMDGCISYADMDMLLERLKQ